MMPAEKCEYVIRSVFTFTEMWIKSPIFIWAAAIIVCTHWAAVET